MKRTSSILKAGLGCLLCMGMESGAAVAQQFSARDIRIRPLLVVGSDQLRHIDEIAIAS